MTPTKTVLLLAASGLALTLGGCKLDNRPLLARFSGQPLPPSAALAQPGLPDIDAPTAAAAAYLPAPPPLPAAGAYPYAERARLMDRIVYEAPPAYGFDYGGAEPWAWQAADDSLMFAEPYGDDYRFYYYEPGGSYPYFVRSPDYGYAYGPNGALLAMFDAAGALIGGDQYDRYYPDARSYWSRGYDLQRAYDGGRRYPVDPGAWAARAPRLRQVEQGWIDAPLRQPAWREWRASDQGARYARADLAPPPMARGAGQHVDNGRHLGWAQGRHEGWYKRADRAQIAAAAPPEAFAQGRGRGAHQGPPSQAAAPNEERAHGHGRAPQFAQAAPPAQGGGHEGRGHGGRWNGGQSAPQAGPAGPPQAHGGGRGHGGGPQFAQAAPAPQPQGGGRGHGGGGQPPPQAEHQGQGGGPPQGHGGGNGKGGGGGGGKGHGHDR